jgi:rhodanese-related sulfurtransferase
MFFSDIPKINKTEFEEKQSDGNSCIVVDVRNPHEYEQGHIDGSINIPLMLIHDIEEKIQDKEKEIICVCASGGRSAVAVKQLQALGYKKVKNLEGGCLNM